MATGLVINTNTSASQSAANLATNNGMLQKSLIRLSSGFKINSPGDDAGGLAVSTKMEAALKRNIAAQNNIGNAVSFLQTQDGALSTMSGILQRISELKILYEDKTKNDSDKTNYDKEFKALQSQLINLQGEKFNGVSVFESSADQTFNVVTSEDGSQLVTVTKSYANDSALQTITGASDLDGINISDTTISIENLATLRAQNGAETNRLDAASKMLVINKINLEAANSRIKDVDIAEETTQFAKANILTQSSTAMLSQANALPQIALKLLG